MIQNRREKNDYDYWEIASFEVRQLIPAGEFQAVFAWDERGDPPLTGGTDPLVLKPEPLDFLAVCRKKLEVYRRPSSAPKDTAGESTGNVWYEWVVCGVQLNTDVDAFSVVEEFSNFCGYVREGQDIRETVGFLDAEFVERVKGLDRGEED